MSQATILKADKEEMTNALRAAICVVIGALMASTICFTSFDLPNPLHGVPYILAVAFAINSPPGKRPGALSAMAAGLIAATVVYAILTHQGLYKELFLSTHTGLAVVTLILCGCLMRLNHKPLGTTTYDRFPKVAGVYGLLTAATLIMLPIGRNAEVFTPEFEIVRRLIVYSTLVMFYPGLVLAIILNFFKPRFPQARARNAGPLSPP